MADCMERREIDRKPAPRQLVEALDVLDRREWQSLDPIRLFAFEGLESIESVDQPRITRHDISMWNHVAELALPSQHTDEKKMLAGLSTSQQRRLLVPHTPKANPIVPRQFNPRVLALVPMQDDRLVWNYQILIHGWPCKSPGRGR